jgi:hypothetical protein
VWAGDGEGRARARRATLAIDEKGSEMNVGHVEIEIRRGANVRIVRWGAAFVLVDGHSAILYTACTFPDR